MIRFGFGTLGMLWATGLLAAGCCPRQQTMDVLQRLQSLQLSVSKLERRMRDGATRREVAGHQSARKIFESCGRLRSDLDRLRGYCPCKDQITPIAADLARAEASLAYLKTIYRKKHPRMVAETRRLAVLRKYLRIYRANGQRVDHCRVLSYLISETFRVEQRHAELSTRYLERHPRVASAATQLGVFRKAVQAARAKCPKPHRP